MARLVLRTLPVLLGAVTVAFAFRLLHAYTPALPALQRFVDRLYFAGHGDSVLRQGALAWVSALRGLARLPWVASHLCARLGVWKRHHFAERYAPLSARRVRQVFSGGFGADDDPAIERAARRLGALGGPRSIRRAFAGDLLPAAL